MALSKLPSKSGGDELQFEQAKPRGQIEEIESVLNGRGGDATGRGGKAQEGAVFRSLKTAGKGAVWLVVVPWKFAMNYDGYASNCLLMDEETRLAMEQRAQQRKKAGVRGARRVTNLGTACVAGCGNTVHVAFRTYDPATSDYLVCDEACASPVGAHKKCIREHMAETGIGRFCYPCENCGGEIKMVGRHRLGLVGVPYTAVETFQFALRHLFYMPIIFCYVWYFILYVRAWLDFKNGIIEDAPTNPFNLRYVMYSADDPDFTWEAQSLRQKWFQGFMVYLVMLSLWKCGIGWAFGKVAKTCRALSWRYEAA